MTRLDIQVSLLHTNFQVLNFQRCRCASGSSKNQNLSHEHQTWVTFQLALCLLPLMILQLYHLPHILHPQSVTLLACSLVASPYMPAFYCSMIFSKVRKCKIILFCVRLYCKITFFLFFCLFMYYLYEKYHKPITIQYYIVNCVSWLLN